MSDKPEKVCVYPCNGIGNIMSSVTRMAGYIVNEDLLPGKTELLCLPATLRGVDEDIEMVEQLPVVVIEGCGYKCASNVMAGLGIRPLSMVYVPEIAKQTGLHPGSSRRNLSEDGVKLAEKVAEIVKNEAEKFFENDNIKYGGQKIKRGIDNRFDPGQSIDKELEYVEKSHGIYRPKGTYGVGGCCGQPQE